MRWRGRALGTLVALGQVIPRPAAAEATARIELTGISARLRC